MLGVDLLFLVITTLLKVTKETVFLTKNVDIAHNQAIIIAIIMIECVCMHKSA